MTHDELRHAALLLTNPLESNVKMRAELAAKLLALADQRSPKPYDQRKIHGPQR